MFFLLRTLIGYGLTAVCIVLTLFSICSPWLGRWNNARRRLDHMRRYEVGFGAPTEGTLASIQVGKFHQIEQELVGLGFEPLGDYVIGGGTKDDVPLHDAPLASPFGAEVKQELRLAHASVCRVLVHRGNDCMASIAAPLSSTREEYLIGLHYLIASVSNDWTYTSHADLPASTDFENSGRDLVSYEGKVPAAQLLQAHLKRRDAIARAGRFTWEAPPSLEKIIAWEVQRYARIREWSRHHSPLALMQMERRQPQRELLGELQGKL